MKLVDGYMAATVSLNESEPSVGLKFFPVADEGSFRYPDLIRQRLRRMFLNDACIAVSPIPQNHKNHEFCGVLGTIFEVMQSQIGHYLARPFPIGSGSGRQNASDVLTQICYTVRT